MWFKNFAGNAGLDQGLILESFYDTGCYRVDIVAESLSVLNLNTMYLMIDDYLTHDGEE